MALFSKHALGIDISDASIEMLELKEKGRSLRVVAYRRFELPDGMVENGQIKDRAGLVGKLKEAASAPGFGRFSTKSAVVSLPESQAYIHLFRLPMVISRQQLSDAIQYEAEETLPLFWDQVRHDYQVVRQDTNDQDVLYVACSTDIAQSYQQVIGEAGFELEVLEAESVSLARALVSAQAVEPVLIADIGARTAILTVVDQQAVHFSENIPIAGRRITDALAEKLSVPKEEADAMKKKTGLNTLPTAQVIEPLLVSILDAINKIIRIYSKNSGRSIKRVLLCGGTSLLPGLAQHFSSQLHIQTQLANPFEGITQNEKIFTTQPPILFSTVIGLAKRGLNDSTMRAGINILSPSKGNSKELTGAQMKNVASKLRSVPTAAGWMVRNKRGLILLAVFVVLTAVFGILYFIKMRPFS